MPTIALSSGKEVESIVMPYEAWEQQEKDRIAKVAAITELEEQGKNARAMLAMNEMSLWMKDFKFRTCLPDFETLRATLTTAEMAELDRKLDEQNFPKIEQGN